MTPQKHHKIQIHPLFNSDTKKSNKEPEKFSQFLSRDFQDVVRVQENVCTWPLQRTGVPRYFFVLFRCCGRWALLGRENVNK